MRKYILVIIFLLFNFFAFGDGVGNWIKKSGLNTLNTYPHCRFSIANKGYFGIFSHSITDNTFWEYNADTDTWTQRADFAGTHRDAPFSFSINNKGYIGTGKDKNVLNSLADFWEYDPILNKWSKKNNFPGAARYAAPSFVIGEKGYVCGGYPDSGDAAKDLWEYNSTTDSWQKKADYTGDVYTKYGFSIGNKGYVGGGYNSRFYEWDQVTDTWSYKGTLPSSMERILFSKENRAYAVANSKVMYEWNHSSDTWTKPAECPSATLTNYSFALVIGDRAFVGNTKEFWEFDPLVCQQIDEFKSADTVLRNALVNFTGFPVGTHRWMVNKTPFAVGQNVSYRFKATGIYTVGDSVRNGTCMSYVSKKITVLDDTTGKWTRLLDFNGPTRKDFTGFAVGNRGYVGMGHTGSSTYLKDFWEWDENNGTWSQKADLPGSERSGASAFSISGKGYVCNGKNATQYLNDLWEYDPLNNSWIQKADFAGKGREGAVSFSVGTKGYILTGRTNSGLLKDCWEWDQLTNSWFQKADFEGKSRYKAVGFSIAGKGYLGTGVDTLKPNSVGYTDFWEWDIATDKWIQKKNFPGTGLFNATGFSIDDNGYVGAGNSSIYLTENDFWKYYPSLDKWEKKMKIPFNIETTTASFSFNKVGFIKNGYSNGFWMYEDKNCGITSAFTLGFFNSLYSSIGVIDNVIPIGTKVKFTRDTSLTGIYTYKWFINDTLISAAHRLTWGFNKTGKYKISLLVSNGECTDTSSRTIQVVCGGQWTKRPAIPTYLHSVAFSIQNKGYIVGLGKILWEYDPSSDTWTQKANAPGSMKYYPVAFAIGNKGYISGGDTLGLNIYSDKFALRDLWAYNAAVNSWERKADFPGVARMNATALVSDNKAYVCTGMDNNKKALNDIWEYNPLADSWTFKTTFPGTGRLDASGFVIGKNLYLGFGCKYDGGGTYTNYSDIWIFDLISNTWSKTLSTPNVGTPSYTIGFSASNKGYMIQNLNGHLEFFWEWQEGIGKWKMLSPCPQLLSSWPVGFVIGDSIYFGVTDKTPLYKYNPSLCANVFTPAIINIFADPNESFQKRICRGDSIKLNIDESGSGFTLQWMIDGNLIQNATNPFYWAKKPGVYTVSVSNNNTSVQSKPFTIIEDMTQKPVISQDWNKLISTTGNQYQWYRNDSLILGATRPLYKPLQQADYSVEIINSNGCRVRSDAFAFFPVAIKKVDQLQEFTIFPNPSQGNITLNYSLLKRSTVRLEVLGSSGRRYLFSDLGTQEPITHSYNLNLSSAKKGIYFISLITDKIRTTRKVVLID